MVVEGHLPPVRADRLPAVIGLYLVARVQGDVFERDRINVPEVDLFWRVEVGCLRRHCLGVGCGEVGRRDADEWGDQRDRKRTGGDRDALCARAVCHKLVLCSRAETLHWTCSTGMSQMDIVSVQ